MSTESSQKWLERNRPPRVQISYEVETGGASKKIELPMVVGILADLGGDNKEPMAKRRFIEIDRDNFDTVMKTIKPTLRISNVEGVKGAVTFEKLEHFEPDYLVENVEGLKELFQQRRELRDLLAKIDGNASLLSKLATVVNDKTALADWSEMPAEPKDDKRKPLAAMSPDDIAKVTPEDLAAYGDDELAALKSGQLAVIIKVQAEALKGRKIFTADQIKQFTADVQEVLEPKDQ